MSTIGFALGEQFAQTAHAGREDGLTRLAAVHAPGQSTTDLFGAAMQRAQAPDAATKVAQAGAVGQVGGATPPPAATPAPGATAAENRERARRALGLDAPERPAAPAAAPEGDAIIEGLQKLRGVFDERTTRLDAIMSSKNVDVGMLMAMQMELVRFSMLVEVTSKLTGKSTQAFDTLMKGQ